MGRLRTLSAAELCLVLGGQGFVEVRRRGGHVVMQRRAPEGTTTLSIPTEDRLEREVLECLIREASLPRALFEE